jgi:hypothetical protein
MNEFIVQHPWKVDKYSVGKEATRLWEPQNFQSTFTNFPYCASTTQYSLSYGHVSHYLDVRLNLTFISIDQNFIFHSLSTIRGSRSPYLFHPADVIFFCVFLFLWQRYLSHNLCHFSYMNIRRFWQELPLILKLQIFCPLLYRSMQLPTAVTLL